jgi:hypothetical protein
MTALRNIVLFLAAFALTCAGIGWQLPRQTVPIVTPKLSWYEGHADNYDVLFLGSSRTYRQIIPEVFDAEMAAHGEPVRAYNLGVDGMRPPEDTYLLEEALAARKKKLKLVLVESNPVRLAMRPEDRDTIRTVYWHDWKRMQVVFRSSFLADTKKRSFTRRLTEINKAMPDFIEHSSYGLWKFSNLGRGHELLAAWLRPGPPERMSLYNIGPRRDGYQIDSSKKQLIAGDNLALYEKELARMRATPPRVDYDDPVSQAELQAKRKLIEAAGGRMVLVIPPYTGEKFFHPKPGPEAPPVLDFSSPDKYPELFLPANRADTGHTNPAGSQIYTRLIVRELLPLLKSTAPSS